MTRNILGDRSIEWSFVRKHLPIGPGHCLDFGPGGSTLATDAVRRGLDVMAIDSDNTDWREQPDVRMLHADLLEARLPEAWFDVVINCSSIEHAGIPGRYGITEMAPDADLAVMAELRRVMRPGAIMLLTIPLGQDAVFIPKCRVYGAERLPRLLDGYDIREQYCYVKTERNDWLLCRLETALQEEASVWSETPAGNLYALGCFVLRKPE